MRAAVVDRYGGPEAVRVVEVPSPAAGKGEVLVRVTAAAVTSGDARIRAASAPRGFGSLVRLAFGVRGPRRQVLGGSLAGVVAEVGPGVAGFRPGDRVCAMTGIRMGAHAEFAVVPVARVVQVPAEVSDADAAGVLFGGTTALHFLRKGRVGAGSTVLVNGASGAVGTNAVQLARNLGATVTAVTSGANAPLVTRLGAADVIDYNAQPVSGLAERGDRFDMVLDTVGNLDIKGGRQLLREGGTLGLVVATLGQMMRARGNVMAGSSGEKADDFAELLALVASGVLTVVHDQAFPLEQIADAYHRVDSRHKVGNVIVTM